MNSPLSFENASSSQLGTILVVDDEPSILAIASAILNTVSSTPLKASNGEEAIEVMEAEYLAGRTITTAIVDLTMPGGLSGFETMEGLKKIDSNIKVIACSGYFQEGALELCQSIGFANILAKPYTPDSFISMIRRTKGEFSASDRPTPAKPRGLTVREKRLQVDNCRRMLGGKAAQALAKRLGLWDDLGVGDFVTLKPEQGELSLPAPRDGLGVMLIDGKRVVFDAKDTEVRKGDMALALMPAEWGGTPTVEVIHAADREHPGNLPYGRRTAMKQTGTYAGGPAYAYATVIGRVIDVQDIN
jgi:CheY-like chemotaxis protein